MKAEAARQNERETQYNESKRLRAAETSGGAMALHLLGLPLGWTLAPFRLRLEWYLAKPKGEACGSRRPGQRSAREPSS